MPQKATRCRQSRNIRGMKIGASAQLNPGISGRPDTPARGLALAKSFLHPMVPPLVLPLQAVRIVAVQDLHTVTGPLRHLRPGSARIQPPRNPGVTEVVRPARQRRGDLCRSERLHPRLPEHLPQRGRLVSTTTVGKEQLPRRTGRVLVNVLTEQLHELRRDRRVICSPRALLSVRTALVLTVAVLAGLGGAVLLYAAHRPVALVVFGAVGVLGGALKLLDGLIELGSLIRRVVLDDSYSGSCWRSSASTTASAAWSRIPAHTIGGGADTDGSSTPRRGPAPLLARLVGLMPSCPRPGRSRRLPARQQSSKPYAPTLRCRIEPYFIKSGAAARHRWRARRRAPR